MALTFISCAGMRLTGGDSGDIGRTASAHAGLPVPTARKTHAPPDLICGRGGDAVNTGGVNQTQYSCGLQDDDPTDPTVPTCLRRTAVMECTVSQACSCKAGIQCSALAAMVSFRPLLQPEKCHDH